MVRRKQQGFTIVELLIVIVVIAILASVTVVAFNGIRGRASDSVIVSDMKDFDNRIQRYKIDHGMFPDKTSDALDELDWKVTKPAYGVAESKQGYNLSYCVSDERDRYTLYAWSPSGKGFVYVTGEGITEEEPSFYGGGFPHCARVGVTATNPISARRVRDNPVWRIWAE